MRAPNCATGPHCRAAILNCIRFEQPRPGLPSGRRRGRSRVRSRQPLAQKMRRLVGGTPIKGHECSRNSGHPHDVRPPAIGSDRCHLDQVCAPPDRFLKAMYSAGHSFLLKKGCWEKGGFYALRACKQAKRVTKTRAQRTFAGFFQSSAAKYIFALPQSTGNAPSVNSFCTGRR